MRNSANKKVKRPDRQMYIPPPKRNKEREDEMKYAKDKYASETANIQADSLGKHNSQEKYTNIVSKKVRLDSSGSSSNSKNTSDESYKDEDSSDFEECFSDFVPIDGLNISKETNENNSNDNWETGGRSPNRNHDIEIENYQTDDKIPNSILMQRESYSDVKSDSNKWLNSESNESKLYKGLFDNYGDSISNIEAVTDSYTKKRSVLTSTPNSDIVEEKVLNAAQFMPEEESGLESTLLDQKDFHETIISTNRNERDNNFDIYCDPPSIENQLPDYSELFGNNYIPPPVPPTASNFHLPAIYRLPSPVSSSYELYVSRHVSFQNMPKLRTQLRHPRHILVPSLRLCPNVPRIPLYAYSSSYMPSVRHALSPCLQPTSITPPNASSISSSIPPPFLSHERINYPLLPQNAFNSSNLYRQSLNAQNLETYKQEGSFYIPPPISSPQLMDGSQQIDYLNLRENVQRCLPSSSSLTNKMAFDAKIYPQNLKMKK